MENSKPPQNLVFFTLVGGQELQARLTNGELHEVIESMRTGKNNIVQVSKDVYLTKSNIVKVFVSS
jgi:hypothetical protein